MIEIVTQIEVNSQVIVQISQTSRLLLMKLENLSTSLMHLETQQQICHP